MAGDAVNALCPNCRDAEGEVVDRTHDSGSGVEVALVCPSCDHDWTVTF